MISNKIIQTTPAKQWEESTPVGNGRMGITLQGGVACEELYLNEESIWADKGAAPRHPELKDKLKAVRDLFLEEKYAEANRLAEQSLTGCFSRICSYEYAGVLKVQLHENDTCRDFRNELDLINGVDTISYYKDGAAYTRTCFASYPDDVMVYTVTSQKAMNARIMYQRELMLSLDAEGDTLSAIGTTAFGDHRFCVKAKVISNGKVYADNGDICVADATEFCVYIRINTAFKRGDAYADFALPETPVNVLLDRHIADFSALMNRASLELPSIESLGNLSTASRQDIQRGNKPADYGLYMLQWQFGRYLLVSSSRPGSLPANLQGVWVNGIAPAWSGDYHFNINLQCNYWATEAVGLSECHQPLFDYMNKYILESGKATAREDYGIEGCVAHHLSDIYGFTSLADGLWGLWQHGGNWLCLHMWEHYQFTQDAAFLKNEAYEFIRQCAKFVLNYMVEDKEGRLMFGPSMSPENRYYDKDKNVCLLTLNSAMDVGIIVTLLKIFIESSKVLGISDDDTAYAAVALTKIPPLKVGKHGQLMEWMEDFEEKDVNHFHISPAFNVYPGSVINRSTPELVEATKVMLHRRLNTPGQYAGADRVGWSLGWQMGVFSRLGIGEKAFTAAQNFCNIIVRRNLWDVISTSWAGDIFQIDGNLAYTAGVTEMLIQSHEGRIALLPALPSVWHYGNFRGFRARGNFVVGVTWKDSSVTEFAVSGNGDCIVAFPPTQTAFTFKDEASNTYTVQTVSLPCPSTALANLPQSKYDKALGFYTEGFLCRDRRPDPSPLGRVSRQGRDG